MKKLLLMLFASTLILFACQSPAEEQQEITTENTETEMEEVLPATQLELDAAYPFPNLSFEYHELEPIIDRKTVWLHYEKHHKGYYKKMLKALDESGQRGDVYRDILARSSEYDMGIVKNAAQVFNHSFYWKNLSPKSDLMPKGDLLTAIERDFGSFEGFQKEFNKAAKTQFGSGWAWLNIDGSGKLFVSATSNHINPLMDVAESKGTPLLTIDVWEHAYYLNYQNKRATYINEFWKIINWQVVEERYQAVMEI